MMETVLISFEDNKAVQNPAYRHTAKKRRDTEKLSLPFFMCSGSENVSYFILKMESSIGISTSIRSKVITPASMPLAMAVVFFGIITPLVST